MKKATRYFGVLITTVGALVSVPIMSVTRACTNP